MFGFSGGELLVVLVVAALVMGPKNVAQALYGLRKLLDVVRQWSAKLRQETAFDLSSLGINPADVEKLKNLDLSQYDPRQMVREAVQEEMNAWITASNGAAAAGKAAAAGATAAMQQAVAPFPAGVTDVSVPSYSAPVSDSSYEMPNYLASPVVFTEAPSTLASSLPVAQPPSSRPPASRPPESRQGASPTDKPDQPDQPSKPDQPDEPDRSVSGGRGASSSDIIDDGPLDLHTILNRPDLGGSR